MEYGSWAEDPNPTNQTFLFTLQILSDIFFYAREKVVNKIQQTWFLALPALSSHQITQIVFNWML